MKWDLIIAPAGEPYLYRKHVLPRNKFMNIYFHKIVKSDDDRALHDHPWWNLSIILKGGYIEVMQDGARRIRGPGSVLFRLAKTAHRLEVVEGVDCYTLFLTGPKVRSWGFHCPKGWVYWRDFTTSDGNSIRGGCGDKA